MRNLFFSILVITNVLTQTNAKELNDSLHTTTDSLKSNFRFEFRKPFIGWEILGPSNLVALTYQQQFLRLGKYSFVDLQMLINNRNILLETITHWDPEYRQEHYRTNKFAIYLLQRNTLLSNHLSFSIGLGYLHYQQFGFLIERGEWDNRITNVYTLEEQNDFVILKGVLSINLSRNILLNFNINHIFDNHKALIPYMNLKDNNYSLSLLFSFNKKNKENETTYAFKNNQLFINLTKLQLGYERVLFRYHDLNMSVSIAAHAIPFKRFGEYSYKRGYETLTDAMVNINYSLNKKMYSFLGTGGFYNYVSYYVLDDKFGMQTYGLRSNIGLAYKLNKRMAVKLAYTPYIIKDMDINIENMLNFAFIRQYKLNAILSYAF
ncbi:MAG: hypothetical protein Fur0028_09120 [Bacteroidales bacterium]